MAGNIECRGRRWWLTVWDNGSARSVHDEKPSGLLSHVEAVEVVPAEQLEGAVEVTDAMCAAALVAERSQRWNSDELRVWAMLVAARDVAGGQ